MQLKPLNRENLFKRAAFWEQIVESKEHPGNGKVSCVAKRFHTQTVFEL